MKLTALIRPATAKLAVALLAFTCLTPAKADTATWTGATDSDWHTASNWSTGAVPDASVDVSIPENTSVIIGANTTATSGKLTVNGTLDIKGTLDSSNATPTFNGKSNVTIEEGASWIVPSGGVIVHGNLTVNGTIRDTSSNVGKIYSNLGTAVITAASADACKLGNATNWRGTYVINWSPTGEFNLNNYGNHENNVVVLGADLGSGGYFTENQTILPAIRLDSDVTIKNGSGRVEAKKTEKLVTFTKLTGKHKLTTFATGNYNAWIWYKILTLDQFEGSLCLSRNTKVEIDVVNVAAEPANGTCVIPATVGEDAAIYGNLKLYVNNVDTGKVLTLGSDGLYAPIELAITPVDNASVSLATVNGDEVDASSGTITVKVGDQVVVTYTANEGYEVSNGTVNMTVAGGTTSVDTSTVSVKPYIAQIGSTNYVSLVTALGEATAGQTVTLLANNTEAAITIPANVTVATAGYSISGTIAGGGNINATADFTPTFGEWTGTFAICWNPDSSTTHLVLNKYGNADSKVEIKGVNGAFIALPSTGKAAPMVDPEIVLTANWTVNDGWDNATTTFKKLSGAGILTINGSGLGTTAIPYTIEVLNGFTGTLAGVRGKYTIGDIVTANDGYGTCLVKYVANYDPVLTNTKVNGTAATLCVDTVNNQKGIYRVAATVNDVPYATLAGAIAAAETANVSEITILDGTTVSPNTDWKIVDGKLVKKVYVAQIGTTKYESLQEALDAVQDGETITVLQDITQDAGFLFDRTGVSAKLDLSNKTLTVNNGSNINNRAIKINNGTLEVCGGTVVAVGAGTNSSNGTGCYGAFRVEANGVLNAHDLALSNARPWGLNVKVLGGEATLTRVTINSSYGGGIEVTEANLGTNSKSGSATLTDCTFTQTGYFDHCSSCLSVSGGSALTINSGTYTSDNYALYVFSSGGTINVNGGTFSGNKNGVAIIAAIDTATYPQYVGGLNITGGKFTGGYSITSPAYMAVSGGIYAVDPSAYAAAGSMVVANTDSETSAAYPYAVATAVARIGTTKYETLQAALNAVQDGDTITLLQDIEVEDSIDIALQGMAILDLNGKTISAAGGSVDDQVFTANSAHDYLIGVKYGATLMIVDSQGGGSVDGRDLLVAVKLTTKGEVYDGETTADLVVGAEDEDNAFTIVGGTYGVSGNGMRHGTGLEVYGGTIIGTAGTGIYNPQDGSLLIQAGTIQGRDSAVEVRAGQASFWGGTYVVTGTDAYSSVSNGNGTTTKGAAIAIVPHTTGKEVVVKVLDGNEAEGESFTFTLPEGAVRFAIANTENSDFSAVDITVADLGYIFGESFALPSGYNWYYANDLELFTLKQTVAELLNGDTHVAYYSTLADAISDATDGQTIKLLANIGLTNRLFINAGATPAYAGTDNRYATTSENKALTIDMNGHNITSESNIALAGGSLTITGTGTITTTASGLAPVEVRGTGSLASKRTLTIGEGVTLDGPSYGLNVFGSNDAQKNKIDVTVGGTVNGTLFVLGNLTNAENEINIVVNGTVQVGPASANAAPNVGIALNGNANVTVNEGASVSGESGIEVRAGNLTVNGGTITATAQTYSYTANGSGSTTRGAAISVAQHTTVLPTAVTLNGGTLEGVEKVYVKEVNTGMPNVTVQATAAYTQNAEIPEGYKWVETATEGVYELEACGYVAQIGETKYETLAEAVAAAQSGATTKTTITLLADIALDNTVEIEWPKPASGSGLFIDLNNHNITATDCRALWIKTGYVVLTGHGTISSVATENSSFSKDSSVIRVGSAESQAQAAATLDMRAEVTVSTTHCYGISVFGNNTGTNGQTLKCSGIVTTTDRPAIAGNGTSTLSSTSITINDGATVSATSEYAIYHPQAGALSIKGTVTGLGGIEMKAGKLTIDSTGIITATGTASHPGVNNNGASTSGYALALVENSGYKGGATAKISNGAINGTIGIIADNNVDSSKKATLAVSGGSFSLAVPAAYCADGYEPTSADGNDRYTVQVAAASAVAKITRDNVTTYYLTALDAVNAARDGETVIMIADFSKSYPGGGLINVAAGKSVTLDLNNHSIINLSATGGSVASLANGNSTLTLKGTGSIQGYNAINVTGAGTKVIIDGNITVTGTEACFRISGNLAANPGVEIKNGTFQGGSKGVFYKHSLKDNITIAITGGIYSIEPDEAFIADGYVAVGNADEATKDVYPWMVGRAVAQIGETKYESLQEAIAAADAAGVSEITILDGTTDSPDADWNVVDGKLVKKVYTAQIEGGAKFESLDAAVAAAQAGDTIKLLADIAYGTDREVPVWGKPVNIDLDGHTLTTLSEVSTTLGNQGYKAAALCFSIADPCNITIGNGTIVTAYGAGVYADDPGITLTLTNLTINAATKGTQSTAEYSAAVRVTYESKVIIESGTYSGAYSVAASNSGADITINGGTFKDDLFFSASTTSGKTKTITITGGEFLGGDFVNTNKGTLTISGGDFAKYIADATGYIVEGKTCTTKMMSNGLYRVVDAATVTFAAGTDAPSGATMPAAITYPSGDAAELALGVPNYSSENITFGGWKMSDNKVVAALPAGTMGDQTLTATWKAVSKIQVATDSTKPTQKVEVKVTEDWVKDNVGEGATDEQIETALEATKANGLTGLENYVLGLDGTAKVKVDSEIGASETAVPVVNTLKPTEQTVDTGFKVQYSLDKVSETGTTITEGTKQDTSDLSLDLTKVADTQDGVGYYKMTATITKEGVEGTVSKVSSENTIGVLAVKDAPATTIIGVPWKSLTEGDIKVDELVRTENLTEGDEIKVYDTTAGKYKAWTLNENKEWEEVATVSQETTEEPGAATGTTVARGAGVWLTRKNPSEPIYLMGQATADAVGETPVEVPAEAGKEAWTLVASPKVEPVKVADVAAGEGDIIRLPTTGAPKDFKYRNGKWGYTEYYVDDNGLTRSRRVETDDKTTIPAGRGFWYINKSTDANKKIDWDKQTNQNN